MTQEAGRGADGFLVSLAYDMRSPGFGAPTTDLYRAAIEQCAWGDRHGFQSVSLMEHHATTDGYLPSPIVLASAIGAVTSQMLIRLGIVTLPLYHPIRLAEDLAVLDLICEGRLRITVGAGYRKEEYEQFDVNIKRRPTLMEEGVDVLKQAWTGEPFDWRGHRVRVLPRPAQRPRPAIAMGGASPASAKRAARIADDYQPVAPRLYDVYLEELAALGKDRPEDAGRRAQAGSAFLHVADDPDKAWAQIAPHALHETNDYAAWAAGRRGTPFKSFADADELRASGMYLVLTPDQAVRHLQGQSGVGLRPLVGGLDPVIGWESLELFVERVLPHLNTSTSEETRES
jgi:alkanesulfonate monooxygenase SsuD/methylene tetrahydromethanopterin reductase-like flavin-dependent oxidoreductase (luciferase family)